MRVVIVGGCRSGKSWLARDLAPPYTPIRCCDPRSKVKEPEHGVQYLPEGLAFSGEHGPSLWICQHWFQMEGPWVVEGHSAARALRRWVRDPRSYPDGLFVFPCDKIIVIEGTRPEVGALLPGQRALNKGVFTVWDGIKHHFSSIVEIR